MDLHSIQGGGGGGGSKCSWLLHVWVPCDGLAPIQEGVVMLLVTLCWVPCDGLASHAGGGGGVVMLLVTLCWVSSEGLAGAFTTSSWMGWSLYVGYPVKTSIPSRGE